MTWAKALGAATPYLLLGVTIFFWGTAFRATDIGAQDASAVVFSALRAVPAALALGVVAVLMGARLPRHGRTWVLAGLSGLLLVALAFEGIAQGTTLAGAGNAAVLINSAPFFTLLLARAFLGERLPALGVAGLGIGFTGVVIMVSSQLGGDMPTGDLVLGMSLALLAGAGFAVGTLVVKALTTREPDLDIVGFTTAQYIIGSVALVPLAFLYGDVGATDWGSGDLWASVAWVALGSSAVASLTFYLALRRIPATRASAFQFLAPVVAVVVELAYGTVPAAVVLAGMALAIGGVALVSVAPVVARTPERPRSAVCEYR